MARGEGACLVCGKSLVYTEKAEKLECQMCHQIFESYACCEDGLNRCIQFIISRQCNFL